MFDFEKYEKIFKKFLGPIFYLVARPKFDKK
ncbi:hypothetical protein AK89_09945 [Enterococcus mundtii CRL35]|nr:hypothetical protein AK89_09945 [Enterococcus mundtii CRL35]